MDVLSHRIFNYMYILAVVLGLLNIILVFIWTSTYLGGFAGREDPLHHFNYHPVFAVLGLIVLYGKGLLLFRAIRYKKKSVLKILHAVSLLVVFTLSVVSLQAVFDSHNDRPIPIPNLYSLHSWIGLGTVILFVFQLLCGAISFLYPGIPTFYRRLYMPYHRFLGVAIFILAVLSCHSGIMEKVKASLGKDYLLLPPAALAANFLGVCIILYAAVIVYLVVMPEFKRRPLPEEDRLQLELQDGIMQNP